LLDVDLDLLEWNKKIFYKENFDKGSDRTSMKEIAHEILHEEIDEISSKSARESPIESWNEEDVASILEEEIKETQEKTKLLKDKDFERTEWDYGFSWDKEIDRVNQEVFKNTKFLNRQREIINAVLSKRDTIALIPTGHGKSLTFQLPAIINEGITIVIMPLLSLIEDQVQKLKDLGIDTVFIHSSNDMSEILSKLK
jgi:ATP-dependent helicase YprA (DUF1998 family)